MAQKKFNLINRAYETLSNEKVRVLYDAFGEKGLEMDAMGLTKRVGDLDEVGQHC